jgi:hypothetical protein
MTSPQALPRTEPLSYRGGSAEFADLHDFVKLLPEMNSGDGVSALPPCLRVALGCYMDHLARLTGDPSAPPGSPKLEPMVGMCLSLEGCKTATAATDEHCCLHNEAADAQTIQRTTLQLLNCWNELDLSNDQSCIEQSKDSFSEITLVRSEEESAQVSVEVGGAASTAASSATLYRFDQEKIREELKLRRTLQRPSERLVKKRLKKQLEEVPEQKDDQPD